MTLLIANDYLISGLIFKSVSLLIQFINAKIFYRHGTIQVVVIVKVVIIVVTVVSNYVE